MSLSNVTAVQGRNPGRRMLLGKPQTIPGAVNFATTAGQHSLSFNQPNSFAVLDLGRIVHGRIEAVVQGGKGTLIDIGWDERLWRDAHPLPHPGSLHPQWTQVDSWVLDGTSRRISTIDSRTGRYVLIAVWGNAPVQITNLRVIEERYPVVQSPAPDFGDATLNAIWRVGRDTALLNMTDAYADPWRERGQWWGDATVVDAVNTAVFNDNALMRRGLLFMAEQFQQMPSPAMAPHGPHAGDLLDYAMLWVQGIRNYVDRTGDTTLVQECYPAIKKFMAHVASFENKQTGLLDMPKLGWWQTAFIDWSAHYNPGGSLSHGQSTPLNAMYYGTLMDAGALAALMGDSAQSEAWTARAGRVRDSINTALYLPDQKRYASSIIDGAVVPPTLFAQAWPLAYGVTPADRQKDVADALLGLISKEPSQPNVQPYGMHWVLKALGDAGRTKEAFNLIKLYYSYMLDRGATTWWETWDADQVYSKSLSHGWGSAPTWFISKYASQIPSVASLHAKTTPQKENTE
jgi:alpha-L-rhamnosidase